MKKYGYLCDIVSQLQEQLEPEFFQDITRLETDLESIRIEINRFRMAKPALAKALNLVVQDVSSVVRTIHEVKEVPSFKATLALLDAWPEEEPIVRRLAQIIRRAKLTSDKASVRSSMINLVSYSCEPVREETQRYNKVGIGTVNLNVSNEHEDHSPRQRQFQR